MLTELKENWVLLDASSSPHLGDFVLNEIAQTLKVIGANPKIIKLFQDGQPVDPNGLLRTLQELKPNRIVFTNATAWRFFSVLTNVECPKYSLWFDDPVSRAEDTRIVDEFKEGSKRSDFKIFVWDRYWREKIKKDWDIDSHHIELAARPEDYYTSTIELTDDVVFIGNLHSKSEMQRCYFMMPRIFQKIIDDWVEPTFNFLNAPRSSSWDQVINGVLNNWSAGDQRLFHDICERNLNHLVNLRWYLWANAKNYVRVEMLRKALEVTPVRMMTETKQLVHAGPQEIKYMVGDFSGRLKIHETCSYKAKELCQLYHYGCLHIQATDPQSVYGGIPYRVYQTAASGRPLLTDFKTDWGQSFEFDKEIIPYSWNFQDTLNKCLSTPDVMKQVGKDARIRFEKDHTWNNRIERMISL